MKVGEIIYIYIHYFTKVSLAALKLITPLQLQSNGYAIPSLPRIIHMLMYVGINLLCLVVCKHDID